MMCHNVAKLLCRGLSDNEGVKPCKTLLVSEMNLGLASRADVVQHPSTPIVDPHTRVRVRRLLTWQTRKQMLSSGVGVHRKRWQHHEALPHYKVKVQDSTD